MTFYQNDEGSGDAAKLDMLPERFVSLEDVVSKELSDATYSWELAAVEERIKKYSTFSEKINAQLSARVMANYNEFVQGMQQVQAVETELTLIGVLVKNGRRKLQERDLGLVQGSMRVSRQHKKAERLKSLLGVLSEFQEVVQLHDRLGVCLSQESYCEAINQLAALREALAAEKFRKFPGLGGLREGLGSHLALVQQKLSDGLRVAAVSADFDAERYEEILKAYSMMSQDQALSVGKELLRHVSECIVSVSRQCMLMFSADATQEGPPDWHRKAQLRDLCRSMDPTHFVDCTAKLYEHLCDFLYRYQFLCRWHEYRAQGAEVEEDNGSGRFREILRDVQSELVASKRNVWHHISQQVSLVLMTLEFRYPALSEQSFLRILHLTQMLIDEGDAFMADSPASAASRASGSGGAAESRRQWSAPIKNTLKSKANDYFQSLHCNAWVSFKLDCIEKEDSWQRLPVARSYQLIKKERLQFGPSRKDGVGAGTAGKGDSAPNIRSGESNPFRNYKPEPLAFLVEDADGGAGGGLLDGHGREESTDDIDEHALLQHWIDDNESLAPEQIGSSMLSNSNRSPVVSKATVELARVLERYFRMMGAIPQLAMDVFQSAVQLMEFYVYCVLCLFVQDRHLRAFLQDLDIGPLGPNQDSRLQQRQEALLLQRLCPDLRRAILRIRESLASTRLTDLGGGGAGEQQVNGGAILQVTPFPKLNSPSSLCGLAERCTGAESVFALLADLQALTPWLAERLPKGEQEAVDRFLASQEVMASQLRTVVLRCAASDVLEVPQMGRVSLDHFSNTMQALKWDARDFSQGSPGAPYVEQLRGQIDELARRIPSAGGGSIPYATQRIVWGWMEVRIMQECVELITKCGRKKSHEAISCLGEDFRSIRAAVQQNFKPTSVDGKDEEIRLLPVEHSMSAAIGWGHLDQYLEAHGLTPNELLAWCIGHPEYPLRALKALIEYLQSNPKAQRQLIIDLESFFVDYIAQAAAEMSPGCHDGSGMGAGVGSSGGGGGGAGDGGRRGL